MYNQNYFIHNILPADIAVLKRDVYLVMMYANRIPPHILLSVNGKLFSLSVKGNLVDEDLILYLRTIKKHKIETLFIKFFVPEIFTMSQLHQTITKITLSYPHLEPGSITCLAPVKDFCSNIYHTDTKDVKFIFDLLPKLEKQGIIGCTYHLNMEKYLLSENNFALNTYSMFEVNENIYSFNSLIV